jgi:CHASE2 domain-containing sensor protein
MLVCAAVAILLIFVSPILFLLHHRFNITIISMLVGIGLMLVVVWDPRKRTKNEIG